VLSQQDDDTLLAYFPQTQRAVASGQILVAYNGEEVVGSGIIM
jgi:tRNA U34 2-thiouridine synthase MnmA/TrmU